MGLDPDLVNVKKKNNPPLETKVKKYLEKQCNALARELNYNCFVDWPPASEFGLAGRPDAFVYIGPHLFLVEVKRDKRVAKLSNKQRYWLQRHDSNHGVYLSAFGLFAPQTFVAWGKAGVDTFITEAIGVITEREELWNLALRYKAAGSSTNDNVKDD